MRIKLPVPSTNVTRRELLKIGAATAAAELAAIILPGCSGGGTSPGPSVCSKLTDIEHVVIFIQENRSFDHYFGSYRGVRGFSDQGPAFQQPDPAIELRELRKDRNLSLPFGNSADVFGRQRATSRYEARV